MLDVGCGQGTQALHLARAGHLVTGLDPSERLLAEFDAALAAEPAEVAARVRLIHGTGEDAAPDLVTGAFDVVLCHGVLMYLDDITPMLTALSAVAGPTGLSPAGPEWAAPPRCGTGCAATGQLRWPLSTARITSTGSACAPARTLPRTVDEVLGPLGWQRPSGLACGSSLITGTSPRRPAAELAGLLAAEREAGGRDPYRSVAAFLHLVYGQMRANDPGNR